MRPDCAIFTPVVLPLVLFKRPDTVLVPNVHHHYGINDRFAVGTRDTMLNIFMKHFLDQMLDHGITLPAGSAREGVVPAGSGRVITNTESLLCDFLREGGVGVVPWPVCVVRVRANGVCDPSDLNPKTAPITCMQRRPHLLRGPVAYAAGQPGPCDAVSMHKKPWARHCYRWEGVEKVSTQQNCAELVPRPVDPVPIRSPQSLHTALLGYFAGATPPPPMRALTGHLMLGSAVQWSSG